MPGQCNGEKSRHGRMRGEIEKQRRRGRGGAGVIGIDKRERGAAAGERCPDRAALPCQAFSHFLAPCLGSCLGSDGGGAHYCAYGSPRRMAVTTAPYCGSGRGNAPGAQRGRPGALRLRARAGENTRARAPASFLSLACSLSVALPLPLPILLAPLSPLRMARSGGSPSPTRSDPETSVLVAPDSPRSGAPEQASGGRRGRAAEALRRASHGSDARLIRCAAGMLSCPPQFIAREFPRQTICERQQATKSWWGRGG